MLSFGRTKREVKKGLEDVGLNREDKQRDGKKGGLNH